MSAQLNSQDSPTSPTWDPQAFGALLRSIRELLGLSQLDFAASGGLDQSSLSRLERAAKHHDARRNPRRPRRSTIDQLVLAVERNARKKEMEPELAAELGSWRTKLYELSGYYVPGRAKKLDGFLLPDRALRHVTAQDVATTRAAVFALQEELARKQQLLEQLEAARARA